MGFLDKVKNMFIEEIEEDEPIKKEEIQVKIEAPVKEEKEEIEEELIEKEEIKETVKQKTQLPNFFDDNDFDEPITPIKKEEIQVKTYAPIKEYGIKKDDIKPKITGYNGKKEEIKKLNFEPTPIISPVYGVLNKNYKKDEITSKKPEKITKKPTQRANINLDDVRKKAYGTLEDDIDITLDSKEHLMFTAPPAKVVEEEPIDIFAELEKEDTLDDLLNSYSFDEEPKIEDELSRNYDIYEDDDVELNDSDLFNLIDSMYEKRDDK